MFIQVRQGAGAKSSMSVRACQSMSEHVRVCQSMSEQTRYLVLSLLP